MDSKINVKNTSQWQSRASKDQIRILRKITKMLKVHLQPTGFPNVRIAGGSCSAFCGAFTAAAVMAHQSFYGSLGVRGRRLCGFPFSRCLWMVFLVVELAVVAGQLAAGFFAGIVRVLLLSLLYNRSWWELGEQAKKTHFTVRIN